MSDHQVNQTEQHKENIFLLWPNIIGYTRILLTFLSLYYMPLHPLTCTTIYSISCLLDALDGYIARYFEQSSRFGAMLDMVTDRCTTTCLLVFLSAAWPRWMLVFQALISLDLASHYMHMYTSLVMGNGGSHKVVEKERSWWLGLYYGNKTILFLLCALNEMFFISIYLLSFSSPAQQSGPLSLLISQNSHGAAALEVARANKIDPFWPRLFAIASSPIMLAKQVINVLQLVNASKWLAEGDVEARRRAGLPTRGKRD